MLGAEATPPARFRRTSGLFRLRLRSGFSDRLRRYFHDGFWLWCRFRLWRGLGDGFNRGGCRFCCSFNWRFSRCIGNSFSFWLRAFFRYRCSFSPCVC